MTRFSIVLKRLRARAGHASARAFYRGAGGASSLCCTYKAYLDVEAGRSVPQSGLALRIARALELLPESRGGRAFVLAYLRSLIGRRTLADALLGPFQLPLPRPAQDFRRAAERSFALRKPLPLTQRQADLVVSDAAHYWAFTLLLCSRERWSPPQLASRLGLSRRSVAAALAGLERAGLLAGDSEGSYCPHIGRLITYPRDELYLPKLRRALRGHWDAMTARRGKVLFEQGVLLRAPEEAVRRLLPALVAGVNGSHIYSLRDGGPDTGLVACTALVRRIGGL